MAKLNLTLICTNKCFFNCTSCSQTIGNRNEDLTKELTPAEIKALIPNNIGFCNITGGCPFTRPDIEEIVGIMLEKADRVVISTNGYMTDKIVALAKKYPNVGIRVSLEGTEETNDKVRGMKDGYKHGLETLKQLKALGLKDIGFAMTVQDANANDLTKLYDLAEELDMEFATAALHNSFYFHKKTNHFEDRPMIAKNFEALINKMLRTWKPKEWFRAYFNHGLINYVYSQPRLLPCEMGQGIFFIDPYGNVMPCNGTKEKVIFGNIRETPWNEIEKNAAEMLKNGYPAACQNMCWMVGSASPAMHRYIWIPAWWVVKHKFKSLFTKKPYSMYELKAVRDLRDGKVTKDELDCRSTCDYEALIQENRRWENIKAAMEEEVKKEEQEDAES